MTADGEILCTNRRIKEDLSNILKKNEQNTKLDMDEFYALSRRVDELLEAHEAPQSSMPDDIEYKSYGERDNQENQTAIKPEVKSFFRSLLKIIEKR